MVHISSVANIFGKSRYLVLWNCPGKRLPSLKFKFDSDLCEEGRGFKDIWKVEIDGITVAAMKWQDTRSVCLVSTFTAHLPKGVCSQYDKKQKTIIVVSCPNIVAVYNKAIRIVTSSQMSTSSKPLYIKSNILPLPKLFEFEIAKIVYFYKFNLLPKIFDNYFSYAKSCHSRTTKFSLNNHLTIPLFKSNRTQRSIKYIQGDSPKC